MQRVVERILNLLAFLLTAGRPVTAAEIRNTVAGYDRDRDEAFRRMFERDKDLLRGLGVPLELRPTDVYEVEEGYVVGDDYALPDPGLTDEERTALLLAAQVVRVGGGPTGMGALFKLGGTPVVAAGEPLAADLGRDVRALGEAFAAVAERRDLLFRYRDRDRVLHPYGLVHRRGHWYVVGPEAGSDGPVKAFRVDRASRVRTGESTGVFDRPADFRADAVIPEAPWEAGEADLEVTVRFDADVSWWARRQIPAASIVESGDGGGVTARLTVANPEAFLGWLIAFEDRAEILEPASMRERLIARVEAGRPTPSAPRPQDEEATS